MSVKDNLLSIIRLGFVNPSLMILAVNVKRSKRTFLSYSTLYSLVKNYLTINRRLSHPLQVAEFGVGRGGSATILAWLVDRYKGNLTLFDVFSRIPAPTEQDGERALKRYKYILNQEQGDYYGNIDNLLDVILSDLDKVCRRERIEIVKGKYEDILENLNDDKVFDLVHIDCDWYESSKAVYSYLQRRLETGAVLQIDDYSNWEGSRRAFQDTVWLKPYQTHIVDGALVIDTSKTNTE
ncbi:MAG: hypothetical protein A2029_14840 [Chloroflexi bacterium RBG_19FT_COMBO_47_9]|nr:MAG: hypothetical protein A2029_14840 [Chloroflexi bacterium RBG_19FT_COMBO_47_9]